MNLGKTIVVPATPMTLFPVEIADVFMLGPSKKIYPCFGIMVTTDILSYLLIDYILKKHIY